MSTEASNAKVWFSARGTVHLPLGGEDRVLRFRTHEIALLEGRMGKGILSLLNEESLGISFLQSAILVGVAHQFIASKGGKKRQLTEAMVNSWMDNCDGEEGRVSFEELTEAVVKAVVGGMPGGQKYLETPDSTPEGAEGEQGPPHEGQSELP